MKNLLFLLLAATAALAQSHDIEVFAKQPQGKFNQRLHGGNGYAPIANNKSGGGKEFRGQMKALHLPIVRTHDIPLVDGGMKHVDISMIFANFHADENDPRNYWFKQTDEYLREAVEDGCKVLFRLGQSIEHGTVKFFVHPPADFAKWGRICSRIIDHYNNGWADGFKWGIEYWEIWNEPDLGEACWTGSEEQFCEFYCTAAKVIKAAHPEVKVGGPAFCAVGRFPKFLPYVKQVGAPLDFYSYHMYTAKIDWFTKQYPHSARKLLDDNGFKDTETILDEWHYFRFNWTRLRDDVKYREEANRIMASAEAGSFATACMSAWQDAPLDVACYYTTCPGSGSWGLINKNTRKLTPSYWCYLLYGKMLKEYPNRVKVSAKEPVWAIAGENGDGKTAVLLSCFKSGKGERTVRFDTPVHSATLEGVDDENAQPVPFAIKDNAVTFSQKNDSAVYLLTVATQVSPRKD